MKRFTVAVLAAAALGLGAASSAWALEVNGHANVNYDAYNSDTEDGNFRASGELDVSHSSDSGSLHVDLDLVNILNTSAPSDIPSGTDPLNNVSADTGIGVDVEQAYLTIPLHEMVSVDAGLMNSPFGGEGQDATDIPFAKNGLLWEAVPSNIAGAMARVDLASVVPVEHLNLNLGFINSRADATGALEKSNDIVVTADAEVVKGISVGLGYLTDNGKATALSGNNGLKDEYGDSFDLLLGLSLNELVDLPVGVGFAFEYLSADPAATSGNLDSGYGLNLDIDIGMVSLAGRWETGEFEGGAAGGNPDQTSSSVAATYPFGDDTSVKVDYSNRYTDDDTSVGGAAAHSTETVTVQFLHWF